MKTIILGSGKGSNAGALLDASSQNLLGSTEIVGVFSDVAESGVLKIADSHNIENDYLRSDSSSAKLTGEDEQLWMDSLSEYNPDLIILAGFMKILQDPFLKKFHNSIINVHPSLLPSFKGLRSIERAFDMGVRITGCTIHWVNSDLDGGKIIAQAPVRIMEGDSLEIVTARVHAAEHMLLPWVVSDLSQGIIPFPK